MNRKLSRIRQGGERANKLVSTMIVIAIAATIGAAQSQDLLELANAERSFAAETVRVGFRDGFIKFFADDGIGFGPHPERTREKLLSLPAATGPRKVVFNWAPMFGDISAAGDLGYTTGPVLYTNVADSSKPPRHGMYFSVWQKQSDGTWKVAIDMGVDTPSAVAPIETSFIAATAVKHSRTNFDATDYRKLDEEFWNSIAKTSPAKAYVSRLDSQFRIHRKGVMPVTERKAIGPVISQWKFELIDGKIASSKDLAFTYGKYTTVNEPNAETGYYVHVWRRDAAGKWKLVVDVQNPLPRDQK
jgi:ketosteroid isomerase-like protein